MSKLIVANCPATVREYAERLQVRDPVGLRNSTFSSLQTADKRDPRSSNLRLRRSETCGRR